MKAIDKKEAERLLGRFAGKTAWIHVEVTPGGFVRNATVHVLETFIAGDGPYRVALKLAGDGWIRMEALTDYEWDGEGRLLLAGHDDLGRLATALQLSEHPFPA